jgi:hypothetical protein
MLGEEYGGCILFKGIVGGLVSGGIISAVILGGVSLMSAPPAPRSLAGAAEGPARPSSPGAETPATVPAQADVATTVEDALPSQIAADAVSNQPVGAGGTTPAATDGSTPEGTARATAPEPAQQVATGALTGGAEPAPTGSAPEAAAISPPAGSEFDKPAVDAPVVVPEPEAEVTPAPLPTGATPDGTAPASSAGETETAPMPSPSEDTGVLARLPGQDAAPAAPGTMDQPALPRAGSGSGVIASAPDAAPTAPQIAEPLAEPAAEPTAEPALQPTPEVPPTPEPGTADPGSADSGAAGAEPSAEIQPDDMLPDEPDAEGMPGDVMPEPAPGESGGAATLPAGAKRVLPPARAQTDAPDTAGSANSEADAATDMPPVVSSDAPGAPVGAQPVPKPGFAKTVPGVRVNRLPMIGGSPESTDGASFDSPAEGAQVAPEVSPAVEGDARTDTRLHRNAAFFENVDKLPVLAVIVIDVGAQRGGADLSQILGLPSPVTVAINPMRKDTLEAAARARARGFEIAMLADGLPKDGTAQDVEVAFQSIGAAMPEAVAVMTSPENGLLARRPIAQQMVAILKDEGLGLVSYARGLNPARELARAQGLPQAEVSRVVDEPRGDAAVVLRALEAEAFQAQQKGGGVAVIRSYPDSIAALEQFMAKAAAPKSGIGVKVGPVTAVIR